MATREELLALRDNPQVQTILNLIAETEGTTKHGYATQFGGGKIASLDDHPRTLHAFGKGQKTSAAGRYQFLSRTWDEEAKQLGLTDFSPLSQDLAAINRIAKRGALDDVIKGDFKAAIGKLGKEWASLPSSPYDQPKKSEAFVDKKLAELGAQPQGVEPVAAPLPQVAANQLNEQMLAAMAGAPRAASIPAAPSASPTAPPAWQEAILSAQQTPAWWEQEAMTEAADDDMAALRQRAVAKFFNEEPPPQIALAPEIDSLINRYLSQI
jgi:muramidase (phage lysozyme)